MELKKSAEFVLQIARQYGKAFRFAYSPLRQINTIAEAAVKKDWMALEHVGNTLKDDYDIVSLAVEQDGRAIQWAGPRVREKYQSDMSKEEAVKIANMSHKSAPSAGTYGNMVAERTAVFTEVFGDTKNLTRKFRYTET